MPVDRADEFTNVIPMPQVHCETCGALTFMCSTKRCNGCWEVEHRLEGYFRSGGAKARAFVRQALAVAMKRAR